MGNLGSKAAFQMDDESTRRLARSNVQAVVRRPRAETVRAVIERAKALVQHPAGGDFWSDYDGGPGDTAEDEIRVAWVALEDAVTELYEAAWPWPYEGEDEHPEEYDGPCACNLCLSYGD